MIPQTNVSEPLPGYAIWLYRTIIRLQVKTESLVWHSPMLNDISAVRSWQKVCDGLGAAMREWAGITIDIVRLNTGLSLARAGV